ncbi:Hypothetical protein IMCC1989_1559 [gamma proteobacterium IMCC1989]|nr:Hypothetical protein IMCC1989_1559 [gamma proteobacterium IMCC1989]
MSNTLRLLTNVVLFQLGWFACLLLSGVWVVLIAITVLLLHFYFIVPQEQRIKELNLIVIVLFVGVILELCYLFGEVLIRSGGESYPAFWLLIIWALFATTFRYSLSWLRPKLWLASIFAGVAAPMSYYAGANLNATVSLSDNAIFSLAVIAVSWAIVFPLLMKRLVPVTQQS